MSLLAGIVLMWWTRILMCLSYSESDIGLVGSG